MQHIVLYDCEPYRSNLLPFTFTRPLALIRIGILTIAQKWQHYFPQANISYKTPDYLSRKFSLVQTNDTIFIRGNVCPNTDLVNSILLLEPNQALYFENELIAVRTNLFEFEAATNFTQKIYEGESFMKINFMYDIFSKNDIAIREDFKLITKNKISKPIPEGNQVISPENIFIEEGATISFSILNASTGPIYIGKDAEIMEGCKIRGPFALCEHAGLKMDAKIYGATTIGPYCKAGGEINNSVMFGYSNKGHDGFLGNAVIGEWCNLGADTNNSNLKNTYDEVKLWNYRTNRFEKTGLTFCGLMMADYTKCGINTMFNTGTVVGVGANIFGAGFPRNFIPSFAWGGAQGFETFVLNKFYKTADAMCKRRNVTFTDEDKLIIEHIFNETQKNRFWENNNN